MGRNTPYAQADRERVLRAILDPANAGRGNREMAAELGPSATVIANARIGLIWADTLPELPRFPADHQFPRRCTRATGRHTPEVRPADAEERERVVRTILSADPMVPHAHLARSVGRSKELVRLVRIGRYWADVCPELPRHPVDRSRRCCECRLFSLKAWRCSLGVPESIGADGELDARWALTCATFVADPDLSAVIRSRDPVRIAGAVARLEALGLSAKRIGLVLRQDPCRLPKPVPLPSS